MRSSRFHTASSAALCGCVREETVGASLDAGDSEVASELWTERVFMIRGAGITRFDKNLSRFQRSFTVIIEGGIGLYCVTVPYPAECAIS